MDAPTAMTKRGMGRGILVLLIIIMLVAGFAAGAFLGPRLGLFGTTSPQKQTVVIGTNTPFPPFEQRNPTSSALEGFDIDLINEVGRRNNWNVVWRDFQDWDALLAAIKFRGVDIGASSITSNLAGADGAAREAAFDFSSPYYESDQGILVKTSNANHPNCAAANCTVAELANHTVAVQTLTSSYWWVKNNLVATNKTPQSMVRDFPDLNLVITELVNGRVDWVMVDKPIADKFAQQNTQLSVEGAIQTDELYAFAVANEDPGFDGNPATTGDAILPKVNAALTAMTNDGTFNTIKAKWLG